MSAVSRTEDISVAFIPTEDTFVVEDGFLKIVVIDGFHFFVGKSCPKRMRMDRKQ